jgi:hypothetical protein
MVDGQMGRRLRVRLSEPTMVYYDNEGVFRQGEAQSVPCRRGCSSEGRHGATMTVGGQEGRQSGVVPTSGSPTLSEHVLWTEGVVCGREVPGRKGSRRAGGE